MNGDFGASVEPETSSSSNNSPTARMFAPSKQPLKSESGKHWIKPNRGALGAAAASDKSGSSEDPPKAESSRLPANLPVENPPQSSKVAPPVQVAAPVEPVISSSKSTSNDNSPLPNEDRPNDLNKRISYKYIPLELASATTVKNSIAKNILYQSLGHGLMVIKYGRQGGPKQRILYCDSDVTKLYWTNSVVDADAAHTTGLENQLDPTKMVNLVDVLEVRAGTDLDPETPLAALKLGTKNGNHAAMVLKQKKEAAIKAGTESKGPEKKKTLVGSIFGKNEKEDELLYGTAILRKKAKPEEFSKCLSLITQDRTIDFQCFSKKDYNLMYINLKEIVNKLRNPTTIPASLAPAVSEYRETLSTKKSVRFASADEAQAFQEDRIGSASNESNTSRGNQGVSKILGSSASFATTMTDSSLSAAEVIELKDGDSIDKLLEMPATTNTTATANTAANGGSYRVRAVSSDSDSGHNAGTFSDEQHRAEQEMVRKLSGISGLSIDVSTYDPTHKPDGRDTSGAKSPYRMKAHEALQIGLILSQQEQQFGTNMYQSLRPEDEPEIEHWNNLGFSTEEAILKIFQKRFQPDLQEEVLAPLSSSSCKFDYDDQFSEAGDTFSGSMKSSINSRQGRMSSFFPQVFSEDSDSEAGDSFAADAAKAAAEEGRATGMTQRQKDMMTPQTPSPAGSPSKKQNTMLRLSSSDALQIGLLLSQQEEEHGVNMYDSLEVSDESTIRKLCQQGFSNDEAVLEIFNRKFGKTGPHKVTLVPSRPPVPPAPVQPQVQQAQPPVPTPALQQPQNMSTPPLPPNYHQSHHRVGSGDVSSPPPAYRSPSPAQTRPVVSANEGSSRQSSFSHEEPPPAYRSPSPQMPGSLVGGGTHQRSSSFSDSSVRSGGSQQPYPTERQAPSSYEQQQQPPPYENRPYEQHSSHVRRPSYEQQPQQQQQPSYDRMPSYERQQPPQQQQQQFSPGAYPSQPVHQQNQYQYQPQYEQEGQFRPPAINTQPPPRQMLQRTNSLAQSSFFPNDPNVRPQYAMNPNGPPPPQGPGRPHTLTRQSSMLSPRTVSRSNMLTTLTDDEAVNMALMLSQQESDHGINMYDSLRASDEQELQSLIASGLTNEQAVLFIFEKRYPPKNVQRAAPFPSPQPVYTNQRQSMYNMQVPPPQPQWEDPNLVPVGYMQPMPPQPMYQMQQPVYGPPPVRMVPRQQSMYVPAPAPMPMQMPMPVPSAIQQQHQLHTMYSSQYNMNVDPAPMPAMRSPQPSPAPVVRQPLARTQSVVVPAGRDQRSPSPHLTPPVVTVVSAVPIHDDDDRVAAPQATHVGYNMNSNVATASASAVPAAQWSPPPAAARPPPTNNRPLPGPPPSHSNNSVSSQSREPPAKLVKKRSIFNFVSSDNSGGGGGHAEKPRYKEADVRAITKMGYSKEQAVWALLQSNNNLPMAIDTLCNS